MKYLVILFVLCLTFGCSESNAPKASDENTFLEQLKSAPHAEVSKESLPEWIVIRINEVERIPPSLHKMQIYQGEWDNQPVYFIIDTFSSCFCDFYTEKGERIVDNQVTTGKNWTLIYKYGELP